MTYKHLHLKKCPNQTDNCFLTLYGCCCGCELHPENKPKKGGFFDF